jgi:hypothetical protein
MFPVQISIHSAAELTAVMTALNIAAQAPGPVAVQMLGDPKTNDAALTIKAEAAAAPTGKPKGAATAPSQRTAEAAPSTPAPSAAAPAQSTEQPVVQPSTVQVADATSADPVTYDDVAKAINSKAKTNRQTVIDVLAKFGAKRGTDLKVEQYDDFLAALA